MKVYYSLNKFIRDLPELKNQQVIVTKDFEKQTLMLDSECYKSLKAKMKKYNVKIKEYLEEVSNGKGI